MAHTFSTLRHALEKLLEAEYFLGRLVCADGLRFQFELNAFLSASRSVTFVLQAVMAHVPGFASWYEQRKAQMKDDRAMRFFLLLRNISQKEGPVSFVGGSLPGDGWTYRFVGGPEAVPDELVGRDIGVCCGAHLVKLGTLLLECVHAFPFYSCPARAMTEDGMAALGYELTDVEVALGLPSGWVSEVVGIPVPEKLRLLRRDVAPLDVGSIERIAGGDLRADGGQIEFVVSSGASVIDDVAAMDTAVDDGIVNPRVAFLGAILKRIDDYEHS